MIMRIKGGTFGAVLAFTSLVGSAAWAQGRVDAGLPKDATSSVASILIFASLAFFVGVMLILMKRSGRMQPKVDQSLQMAEEGIRLAKEQVALQAETNRLLVRLIEVLSRT
jgi:hypothetical protein